MSSPPFPSAAAGPRLPCPLNCGEKVLAKELAAHKEVCPRRIILCPLGCGCEGEAKMLPLHCEKYCPKRPQNGQPPAKAAPPASPSAPAKQPSKPCPVPAADANIAWQTVPASAPIAPKASVPEAWVPPSGTPGSLPEAKAEVKPAKDSTPHPLLLAVRKGVADGDKAAVRRAIAECNSAKVTIAPALNNMLKQWLGPEEVATKAPPASAPPDPRLPPPAAPPASFPPAPVPGAAAVPGPPPGLPAGQVPPPFAAIPGFPGFPAGLPGMAGGDPQTMQALAASFLQGVQQSAAALAGVFPFAAMPPGPPASAPLPPPGSAPGSQVMAKMPPAALPSPGGGAVASAPAPAHKAASLTFGGAAPFSAASSSAASFGASASSSSSAQGAPVFSKGAPAQAPSAVAAKPPAQAAAIFRPSVATRAVSKGTPPPRPKQGKAFGEDEDEIMRLMEVKKRRLKESRTNEPEPQVKAEAVNEADLMSELMSMVADTPLPGPREVKIEPGQGKTKASAKAKAEAAKAPAPPPDDPMADFLAVMSHAPKEEPVPQAPPAPEPAAPAPAEPLKASADIFADVDAMLGIPPADSAPMQKVTADIFAEVDAMLGVGPPTEKRRRTDDEDGQSESGTATPPLPEESEAKPPPELEEPPEPEVDPFMPKGWLDTKDDKKKEKESWEYMKPTDNWGSGNFFDFNSF